MNEFSESQHEIGFFACLLWLS